MPITQYCSATEVSTHLDATSTGTAPNRVFTIFGVQIDEPAVDSSINDASIYIKEMLSANVPTDKPDQVKYFAIDLSCLFILGRVFNGLGIIAHFNYQLGQMRVDKPLPSQMMAVLQRFEQSVRWWKQILQKKVNIATLGDVEIPAGHSLVPQKAGVTQVSADSAWQGT